MEIRLNSKYSIIELKFFTFNKLKKGKRLSQVDLESYFFLILPLSNFL